MDMKKISRAALLPIIVSLVLGGIGSVLEILSAFAGDNAQTVLGVNMVYSYLLVPLFLILYVWTGGRAVRKYGLEPMAAGASAGFAYFVTGIISVIINTAMTLLIVNGVMTLPAFTPPEAIMATIFFGNVNGIMGAGLGAVCGIGYVAIGVLISFAMGAIGGLFAQRRWK